MPLPINENGGQIAITICHNSNSGRGPQTRTPARTYTRTVCTVSPRKNRVDAVPCAARRRFVVRQSRSMAFRVSKVDLVVEMLVFPTNTRRGTGRMQPAVVPPHTTVRPTYPRVSHGLCTSVESWKWNVLRCTRWRCVVNGWKVGAALKSHRKCVPWFQLRLAAHASPSGHVAVIARCWRSRKATVPKEVVSGARSHRGCPPHDFWAYVGVPVSGTCSTMRVQGNVGGGGRLQVEW